MRCFFATRRQDERKKRLAYVNGANEVGINLRPHYAVSFATQPRWRTTSIRDPPTTTTTSTPRIRLVPRAGSWIALYSSLRVLILSTEIECRYRVLVSRIDVDRTIEDVLSDRTMYHLCDVLFVDSCCCGVLVIVELGARTDCVFLATR